MRSSLVICCLSCMVSLAITSTSDLSGDYLPGRSIVEKKLTLLEDRNNVLEDLATNSLTDMNFSWGNMLGMVMQLLLNPGPGDQVQNTAPSKSDNNHIETETITTGAATSPWANVLSIGLKILTAFLGGGGGIPNDGIDKVDNSSPMQGILAAVFSTMLGSKDPEQVAVMAKQAGEFINIVVNLLDALKTSFSHRSLSARYLGKKDSVSDASKHFSSQGNSDC